MSSPKKESTTGTAGGEIRKPNNVIQVSVHKTIFPYIEMTKRLLDQGEKEVEISGLGMSVNSVASIADVLSGNGFVRITKLQTSRGDVSEARRMNIPRLQIFVSKSAKFDELYSKEKAEREARRAEKEAAKGEKKDAAPAKEASPKK